MTKLGMSLPVMPCAIAPRRADPVRSARPKNETQRTAAEHPAGSDDWPDAFR